MANSELLTREDAAAYLDVKPQTLACWASTKRYGLRYVKVGRNVRYRKADLDRFLEARTVGAVADSE
jgi:excisionase family DNA binding protein